MDQKKQVKSKGKLKNNHHQGCLDSTCTNEIDWVVVAYKITEEAYKQTMFKGCDEHMELLKKKISKIDEFRISSLE